SVLLVAALFAVIAGCETGPSIPYDPSKKPACSTDKIAVVSIRTIPAHPVAHQGWKVAMVVRNVGQEVLKDVTYEFVYEGGATKFGSGMIPQINPGQSIEIASSNGEKLEQGWYRIEGRVFLCGDLEPLFSDRMNNWKQINVGVAQ